MAFESASIRQASAAAGCRSSSAVRTPCRTQKLSSMSKIHVLLQYPLLLA